jgi:N-acetylmuramoyl-L-alanine amidase
VTVGIDPGHNGRNGTDPGYIGHRIWNGRAWEACDTTGTQTDAGYTEARFTFDVARFLRGDLRAAGARVVMTRTSNRGVGPCVDRRARIINRGHARVAVDIHADGGPSWGRGFSILEPVPDGPNNKIIASSARLARAVRAAVRGHTPMPVSNYYGRDGLQPRSDLAGLNLATEPKILIESGNMRNGADARLLTSAAFQRKLAKALEDAIVAYLSRH